MRRVCDGPGEAAAVAAMEKPGQWTTLQEFPDELEHPRPAWEATDLDGVLADGQLPASSQDAQRHQLVVDELLARPSID